LQGADALPIEGSANSSGAATAQLTPDSMTLEEREVASQQDLLIARLGAGVDGQCASISDDSTRTGCQIEMVSATLSTGGYIKTRSLCFVFIA
jgi:hypothetical protein